MKARIGHRAWRKALDRLPDSKCNVLRVESDKSQILYHHFSEKPGRVGVVSWHHETMWSAPAPEEVPRLAFHEGRMFVLHEYEAHSLNEQGQVEAVYPVPQGFHYSDLDTVPAQNDYPAALVLVCSSLADPQLTQVLVYRLDNGLLVSYDIQRCGASTWEVYDGMRVKMRPVHFWRGCGVSQVGRSSSPLIFRFKDSRRNQFPSFWIQWSRQNCRVKLKMPANNLVPVTVWHHHAWESQNRPAPNLTH